MKFLHLSLLMLFAAFVTVAYAENGKQYGKAITLKKAVKVSEIMASPAKFNGKKVLVEGPVVGVCEKRGCWIKIGSDKEFEAIQFKVDDGVIVFPLSAKGKTVRAEGVVSVKDYTKEELIEQGKKEAKEGGKEFDPASVKGPKTIVMIKGEGAVIK
jgi:hypothetical protein